MRGAVQIFVRKGKPIHWIRAKTPTHFITMGLNPDLDEAPRRQVADIKEWFPWFRSEPRAMMVLLETTVSLKLKTRSDRPRPECSRHCRRVADLRALHEKSFSHLAKNF
jgi:hypothetical protein